MSSAASKDIFESVIKQNLCVGCGACFYPSFHSDLSMAWNSEGFLVPMSEHPAGLPEAGLPEAGLKVCPFNPFPEEAVKTEDELADIFLKDAPRRHPKVGHYYNTYAGYSSKYRLSSSSGGLATYLIDALLKSKSVDAVLVVKEVKKDREDWEGREESDSFYEYSTLRTDEDCTAASKTKYYPVSMAGLMEQLRNGNERYAVVGIACFIKAIRLLQYYHPELNEKIVFTIGIICGGLKSRFFAEYLAGRTGTDSRQFSDPQFRLKDVQSTASDYSYACKDQQGRLHTVKMSTVGDMWGTGLFKNNACDFCDDVTAELADISLGDAWLSPYKYDGKGTNVVVTRSRVAEALIQQGIEKKELIVEPLAFDRFLHSQQGSFNHRHRALGYRMKLAGVNLPPKRHDQEKISSVFALVQQQRRLVRRLSLTQWAAAKDSAVFDRALHHPLLKLKIVTKIYHYLRAIQKK